MPERLINSVIIIDKSDLESVGKRAEVDIFLKYFVKGKLHLRK